MLLEFFMHTRLLLEIAKYVSQWMASQFMFSCATKTGAQPSQKSTPSANNRNRASVQRDVPADSIDEEHQQVS
jgi:hypothetical protein